MTAFHELPEWERKLKNLKADVGENPGRFLDRRVGNPPPQNSMFRARLKGIDRIEVVGAFEAAERILADRDDREPREHVMRLLDQRREYLLEHGERPAEWGTDWPHELPDRYLPRARERDLPEKEWYWIEGSDRSGERRPWSQRPTSIAVGNHPFSSPSKQVATDGGDSR